MSQPSPARRWKRGAAAVAGVSLLGALVATQGGPVGINASSHREAPLIAGDPRADNTDVYAFVSPDAPDTVTLISNWIPFEEPNGGPNFYPWAEDTQYNIKIDNDGDAVADLNYTWIFETVTKDPGQFLVNTGPFSSVDDATLNVYQTYDLIVTDDAGNSTLLLDDAISAPSISGAVSTPDYQPLVDEAVASGTVGDLKSFAGQADDPFFLDLRVFDLLYGATVVPEVGEDTLAGYNVNSIALQIPASALALDGDAAGNPVIGIWSTTDRLSATVNDNGTPDDDSDDEFNPQPEFVQVSRLGNPLVNEVVLPLALKDAFNSIPPTADATIPAAVDAVVNPILPGLIEAIYGVPAPAGDRQDLVEIFLQGISKENVGLDATVAQNANPPLNADLNSLKLNTGVDSIVPSEMLRLNMAVPPSANPNSFGVLAGDFAGFPNGRRLTDDVVDAAIQVVEGAARTGALNPGLLPFDSVDRNDREFGDTFPYLALPHLDSVNNGTERTPRAPEVVSITPERILETRASEGQVGYSGSKPQAEQTIELQVAGVGTANIPSDVKAVYLNITAVNTDADGFITAYPCDEDRPTASNLNPDTNRVTNGLVPALLDDAGKVCLFTKTATDIIVDVTAFHPSTASYTPIVPERLLETRPVFGQIGYSGPKPADRQEVEVQVTGFGVAQLPVDTKSVLVNITTVNTVADGWLVAYPCDSDRPEPASNLNTTVGEVRTNLASVQLSADGTLCVYNKGGTDILVDLVGAAPSTSSFVPTAPTRVLETRAGEAQLNYSGAKPIGGQTIELKVVGGSTGVPADAGTVYLNVTAVDNDAPGFITVFPCGQTQPKTSNVNIVDVTTAAMVASGVGENGRVCLFTKAGTDVVVDLMGYFPGTILAD